MYQLRRILPQMFTKEKIGVSFARGSLFDQRSFPRNRLTNLTNNCILSSVPVKYQMSSNLPVKYQA